VPLRFIVAALGIVVDQIVSDPRESAFGLLLVAAGLPAYYFPGRQAKWQGLVLSYVR
jgi:hypothetical protein